MIGLSSQCSVAYIKFNNVTMLTFIFCLVFPGFSPSFLTNVQYFIVFNTYRGGAEYTALTAPLPLSLNIVFTLCVPPPRQGIASA